MTAALAKESTHQVNRTKYKRSNWQVQKVWLEDVEGTLLKDERWMQEKNKEDHTVRKCSEALLGGEMSETTTTPKKISKTKP